MGLGAQSNNQIWFHDGTITPIVLDRRHKELDLTLAFDLSEDLDLAFQPTQPLGLTFAQGMAATLMFDGELDLTLPFAPALSLVLRLRVVEQ